ncbi:MAG: hypothetical protein RLZZ330_1143, partial [Actinomycetota bacterium]
NYLEIVFVAGHAASEGTAKAMTALSKARTLAAKNYLRLEVPKVLTYTSMGDGSASGSVANSRRVDIVMVPVDEWAYDFQ